MANIDTRLVLVRHGQSIAQAEGFYSGHDTCRGLSDLGRTQAKALRARLQETGELRGTDVLYTSNLARAIETADLIEPALDAAVRLSDCDFCEIRAGEAEGLSYQEAADRFPPPRGGWGPYTRRMPGSETWAEFFVRAGTRLRRMASEHENQRIVVVCHGGIIGATFASLGHSPLTDAIPFAYEPVNTSITEWRHTGRNWRLVRYNDVAHLPGDLRTRSPQA
jgi:broad specificity phosphatase PhoE